MFANVTLLELTLRQTYISFIVFICSFSFSFPFVTWNGIWNRHAFPDVKSAAGSVSVFAHALGHFNFGGEPARPQQRTRQSAASIRCKCSWWPTTVLLSPLLSLSSTLPLISLAKKFVFVCGCLDLSHSFEESCPRRVVCFSRLNCQFPRLCFSRNLHS